MRIFVVLLFSLLITATALAKTYVIPYYNTYGSNTVGLSLLADRPATITVRLYCPIGNLLAERHVYLNPKQAFTIPDVENAGSIRIISNVNLKGMALAGAISSPIYDMDVQEFVHKQFLVGQVDTTSGWESVVMIAADSPTHVNTDVYNKYGNKLTTITADLPKNGSIQIPLSKHVNVSDGYIIVKGNNPIAVFVLYFNNTYHWKTGLTAIPLD